MIYNRRGPDYYNESFRLLTLGDYFIQIDIGEKDCREIKKVFGRNQDVGEWNNSKIEIAKRKLKEAGFAVVYARDFL